MEPERCAWCGDDPLYISYHDEDWGVPVHDDIKLFEMLTLEGAQAGLSWITILKKRASYQKAFDNFDLQTIAGYNENKLDELRNNSGIVRNRLKIASVVKNANTVLKIQEEFESFDTFIWQFVDGKPKQNAWTSLSEIPSSTKASDLMSKDLKKRGCSFVGPTICYAFMQAVGMVNDHTTNCFRYKEVMQVSIQ